MFCVTIISRCQGKQNKTVVQQNSSIMMTIKPYLLFSIRHTQIPCTWFSYNSVSSGCYSYSFVLLLFMFIHLKQVPLTKIPRIIQCAGCVGVAMRCVYVCVCVFACEWQGGNPITFCLISCECKGREKERRIERMDYWL